MQQRDIIGGPLWSWMTERHAIYLRKQAVEGRPIPDWATPGGNEGLRAQNSRWDLTHCSTDNLTTDNVLREFRFCNVFRELDTVTIWVEENIRKPYADHPNLWLMLAIARTINWPPTLQYLINTGAMPTFPLWVPNVLTRELEKWAQAGNKTYTGAYMIRAESNPMAEWYSWTKHRYLSEIVIGRLWEDRLDWEAYLTTDDPSNQLLTLRDVWERFQFKRYIGWGPFMAYEVVTDMAHTRYLTNAPDRTTWANAGPGALRGLNRLLDRPLKAPMKQEEANGYMMRLLGMAESRNWPSWFPSDRFEMRDIEHSLCEMDKWLRVKRGEGRPRAKYVPGRGS